MISKYLNESKDDENTSNTEVITQFQHRKIDCWQSRRVYRRTRSMLETSTRIYANSTSSHKVRSTSHTHTLGERRTTRNI